MKKLSLKSKRRILEIIALVFFLSGILTMVLYKVNIINLNKKEQEMIDIFLEKQVNIVNQDEEIIEDIGVDKEESTPIVYYNYVGVLEIPKINLRKGFTSIDDKDNNLNKNIKILKESDMPNVVGGNLIIAGHSGTGRIAFFKDLKKLSLKDSIYIYYQNKKYIYEVVDIYEIEKNGTMSIKKNKNETTLTLITCSESNENKQIVLVSYLKNNG